MSVACDAGIGQQVAKGRDLRLVIGWLSERALQGLADAIDIAIG